MPGDAPTATGRLRVPHLGYIPPIEWENQHRQPEADQAA
jgi:hypothetical protein